MSSRSSRSPAIALSRLALPLCVVASVLVGVHASSAGAKAAATTVAATTAPSRVPVGQLRLMNYYPATHGWTAMWTAFDAAEMDRDMARIAGLGANAVRFIVQPQAFGYPVPTQQMQDRLAQAVAIAAGRGLSVELTLFDWFSTWSDVSGSQRWASAVLAPYAHDPRIAAVELRNELPLDDPTAVSWAAQLLPTIGAATDAPTTISVTGAATNVGALKARLGAVHPTFWSYHYYDQSFGAGAMSAFDVAKAAAAPEALFIGETGTDTLPRAGEDAGAAEARQDHFLRAVFAAATADGLGVPAPWILSDFASGAIPGTPGPTQYLFGLYRLDGTAKPAAASVRAAFTGQPMSTDVGGGFEGTSLVVPGQWAERLADQASFAVDPAVARSGSRSLRVSASLGDATGWPSAWTGPVQPVRPGTTFTVTAWAKGTDVTGTNRVALTWYDRNGAYLGASASDPVAAGTTPWRQLVARGAAPTGAAAVLVHLQSTRNTGTVWFDDVQVAAA
jgi:hypothetical protein